MSLLTQARPLYPFPFYPFSSARRISAKAPSPKTRPITRNVITGKKIFVVPSPVKPIARIQKSATARTALSESTNRNSAITSSTPPPSPTASKSDAVFPILWITKIAK